MSGDASTAPLQTPVWSTRILSLEGEGDPYPLVSVASLFTFPVLTSPNSSPPSRQKDGADADYPQPVLPEVQKFPP